MEMAIQKYVLSFDFKDVIMKCILFLLCLLINSNLIAANLNSNINDKSNIQIIKKKINGINISIKEGGKGPDLILIHGKCYSKENMNMIFDYYKDNFHVVSYDVRGHGESDKPESFSLEDNVSDLAEIIKTFDMKKTVVIGFSMGSYIALKTAETYPDLFSKIILIGTKGGGSTSSTQKMEDDAKSLGLTKEEISQRMIHRVFAPQTKLEDIKAFDKQIASSVKLTEYQKKTIDNSLHDFDLIKDASKVTIPVLLMTGEYDGINPPVEAEKLSKNLPDARFEIIPEAGHIAFFENPKKVFSLIDDFLYINSDSHKLSDYEELSRLTLWERQARVRKLSKELANCYWPDATVTTSWTTGKAENFLKPENSQERRAEATQNEVILNRSCAPIIHQNGNRAYVELPTESNHWITVNGEEAVWTSYMRLLYCCEKRNNIWKISDMTSIFERDKLTPVIAGTDLHIKSSDLKGFRPSYLWMSYIRTKAGGEINHDLLGIDRPDEINEIYSKAESWIANKK